ncbi:voltage-dependent anion channel-domain-containing protein [Cercophora newfieldiana]|uniref:Voltage-dependent anion channel-domain-containing protein n=1 Tax=Cercophora newfieldiana TaxID=92897 RepID=A0AA39YJ80_9PEZI|nr:voltage-dependent anion channel-domain-containing protein [Cercophora newfieldiana]
MSRRQPNKRNAFYFQNMAQHSSKIYEFFGFTPGQTPPVSRIFNGGPNGNANGNAKSPDTNIQRSDTNVTQPPDTATTAGFTDAPTATATANGHVPNGRIPDGHPINGAAKHPPLPTPTTNTPRESHPIRRSPFRALVQDFGAIWFTLPLNTGILSLLLRLLPPPFHFPGLLALSVVLITLTLVLFALTSLLFLLRLAWFRRSAYDEISSSAGDDLLALTTGRKPQGLYGAAGSGFFFLPCWPTVWMLIVAFAVLDGTEAQVGRWHRAFARFGYVAWWVGAAWTAIILFCVLGWLLSGPRVGVGSRTGGGRFARPVALVVATGSVATVGWVGGLLGLTLGTGDVVSVQLLGPVVVFSFCAVGVAVLIAVFVFAGSAHELMLVTGWPPPEQTSAMFFFIGPLGISASALLFLGTAVENNILVAMVGDRGSLPSKAAAQAIHATCILMGLLLVGMPVVSLILAFMAIIYRLSRRELQWNPTWNGVVFPVATLGVAAARFSVVLQSHFLGVLTCILAVLCSFGLVVHLSLTIMYAFKGKVLIVREDRRLSARLGQSLKSS